MDFIRREEFEAFRAEVDERLRRLEPIIVPGWTDEEQSTRRGA